MTPHLLKLQYNRNCQGIDQIVYISSYMKCFDFFLILCVVYFNSNCIDFYNFSRIFHLFIFKFLLYIGFSCFKFQLVLSVMIVC